MTPRHHIIISGTGRSGTTFLVQLLTALGLPTGFRSPYEDIFEVCNAGMEADLRLPDAPYIVKSPALCKDLNGILNDDPSIIIDCAIVPIRSISDAAESRRDVARRNNAKGPIAGGLWGTTDFDAQEDVLAHFLYRLMHTLASREIPVVLLEFPSIVHDAGYLYRHLSPLFPFVGRDAFIETHAEICQPELVHDFSRLE
jgi:hypothetical protein